MIDCYNCLTSADVALYSSIYVPIGDCNHLQSLPSVLHERQLELIWQSSFTAQSDSELYIPRQFHCVPALLGQAGGRDLYATLA